MYSLAPDTYKVSRSDVGRDALLNDSFSESLRHNLKIVFYFDTFDRISCDFGLL